MRSRAGKRGRIGKGGPAGQALLEFALVVPLLFLLVINVVNFGGLLYAWITVVHASRNGVQYFMMGNSTIGSPAPATPADVGTLVAADLSYLPSSTSSEIKVCTNSGTASCTCTTASCTHITATTPSDPETLFTLGSVDVYYPYTPFVTAFNFPSLGITLTLPPTSVHRQCVMRLGGA
jgi:Flp pilus assembly protein TadG